MIQQIGTPHHIYSRPANVFVATFIGHSNLFYATLSKKNGKTEIVFRDGCRLEMNNLIDDCKDGQEVIVGVRPEEFYVSDKGLSCKVENTTFLGRYSNYFLKFADGICVPDQPSLEFSQDLGHTQELYRMGDTLKLVPDAQKINVFTADMEHSLMKKRKLQFDFWTVVTIGIIAVFALFLIYPLISLFIDGFLKEGTGEFTMANFQKFFGKKFYYRSLLNSLKLTVCVTICSLVIGVPLAYFMSFYKIRGKGIVEILIIISMMSPNFIGAYSWILLLGRSGVITTFLSNVFGIKMPSIYGFGGMLLVFTLKLYPFIYMYVSGALKKIDVAVCEAAESLGCYGIRKVFTVVMPLVMPTAIASALLVFMNCMADFGTPALIGEGFDVLPTKIYIEFVGESGGSAYFASAMASIMVVITAVLFLMQKWYVNKKSFTMSAMRPIQPERARGVKNVLMHVFTYILVVFSVLPHLVIVWTSFRKTEIQYFVDGYSLESYTKVFGTAWSAIRNTYLYCIIALAIIVVLGMFIAYLSVRRKSPLTSLIDTIAMFPYIVPGSVLGITLLLAFNGKGDPMILSGTATIMIISLVIRRLAYTLRSSSAILYQISPSVEEAAISLGDSPMKAFFKVTAKMMLPGVVSGAILSWITLINELSSSVMLYTSRTRTMSVAIYNEVIRASYGTAAALATILTCTTVISLLVFFKISGSRDVTM